MDSVLQKYRVFKNFIFKISFYKLSQSRFMDKPAKQGEPSHKHKPVLYLPKNNIRISKLLFFSQAYCHTFCQTVDCVFFLSGNPPILKIFQINPSQNHYGQFFKNKNTILKISVEINFS